MVISTNKRKQINQTKQHSPQPEKSEEKETKIDATINEISTSFLSAKREMIQSFENYIQFYYYKYIKRFELFTHVLKRSIIFLSLFIMIELFIYLHAFLLI